MLSLLKPETALARLPLPRPAGHAPETDWLEGGTAGITVGLGFHFVRTRRGAGGGGRGGAILSH